MYRLLWVALCFFYSSSYSAEDEAKEQLGRASRHSQTALQDFNQLLESEDYWGLKRLCSSVEGRRVLKPFSKEAFETVQTYVLQSTASSLRELSPVLQLVIRYFDHIKFKSARWITRLATKNPLETYSENKWVLRLASTESFEGYRDEGEIVITDAHRSFLSTYTDHERYLLSIPFASNHVGIMARLSSEENVRRVVQLATRSLGRDQDQVCSAFFYLNMFFLLRDWVEVEIPDDVIMGILCKACQGGSGLAIFTYANEYQSPPLRDASTLCEGFQISFLESQIKVPELVHLRLLTPHITNQRYRADVYPSHMVTLYKRCLEFSPCNAKLKFTYVEYLCEQGLVMGNEMEVFTLLREAHGHGHLQAALKTLELLRSHRLSDEMSDRVIALWKTKIGEGKRARGGKRKADQPFNLENYLCEQAEDLTNMHDFRRLRTPKEEEEHSSYDDDSEEVKDRRSTDLKKKRTSSEKK